MAEIPTLKPMPQRSALDLEIDRLWHVAAGAADPAVRESAQRRHADLVARRKGEQNNTNEANP